MKLVHYSAEPLPDKLNFLEQKKDMFKPTGFWVSDDDCDDNWFSWCVLEGFRLEALTYVYDVQLSTEANILILNSAEDIDQFSAKFGIPISSRRKDISLYVDWLRVRQLYDGIIITPYIWSRRLEQGSMWYYSWDCASGCIWNPETIAQIQLREMKDLTHVKSYLGD
jgi:hypothetical protein